MLETWLRVLTFRAGTDELTHLPPRLLAAGLAAAWLAGIGRTWDDPGAPFLRRLGLGSVVYVFALSALLSLVIKPLRPRRWTYRGVCTYVALTAPPAFVYAVPVEMFMTPIEARDVNTRLLTFVATWRLALLVAYLKRGAQLSWARTIIGTLLPMAAIVSALAWLNLDRVVFDLMRGHQGPVNPHEGAYLNLVILTYYSYLASVPLLLAYLCLVVVADYERRAERGDARARAWLDDH